MHTSPALADNRFAPRSNCTRSAKAVMVALLALTIVSIGAVEPQRTVGAAGVTATSTTNTDVVAAPASIVRTDRNDGPDAVGDQVGGIAARLRSGDDTPVPGDVFLLMAVDESTSPARVYDETPYGQRGRNIHPDAVASNSIALDLVERITRSEITSVDFTSAPGGGPSAGLTYAIAYLNIVHDGEFTGALTVGVTGELTAAGYVQPITAVDEKAAAAHLVDADVLFTPSEPMVDTVEAHGDRFVGELFRSRGTDATLASERQWNQYEAWGVDATDAEMDIVGVRHLGDVAAYLCGSGSRVACDVRIAIAALDASEAQPAVPLLPVTAEVRSDAVTARAV